MRSRFEVQSRTSAVARDLTEIFDQGSAGTGGTLGFIRHQIVNVEAAPDVGILELAKNGDTGNPLVTDHQAHLTAITKDAVHLVYIVYG